MIILASDLHMPLLTTVFSILKYALIPPKRPERIVSGVPPEETGLLVLVQW